MLELNKRELRSESVKRIKERKRTAKLAEEKLLLRKVITQL